MTKREQIVTDIDYVPDAAYANALLSQSDSVLRKVRSSVSETVSTTQSAFGCLFIFILILLPLKYVLAYFNYDSKWMDGILVYVLLYIVGYIYRSTLNVRNLSNEITAGDEFIWMANRSASLYESKKSKYVTDIYLKEIYSQGLYNLYYKYRKKLNIGDENNPSFIQRNNIFRSLSVASKADIDKETEVRLLVSAELYRKLSNILSDIQINSADTSTSHEQADIQVLKNNARSLVFAIACTIDDSDLYTVHESNRIIAELHAIAVTSEKDAAKMLTAIMRDIEKTSTESNSHGIEETGLIAEIDQKLINQARTVDNVAVKYAIDAYDKACATSTAAHILAQSVEETTLQSIALINMQISDITLNRALRWYEAVQVAALALERNAPLQDGQNEQEDVHDKLQKLISISEELRKTIFDNIYSAILFIEAKESEIWFETPKDLRIKIYQTANDRNTNNTDRHDAMEYYRKISTDECYTRLYRMGNYKYTYAMNSINAKKTFSELLTISNIQVDSNREVYQKLCNFTDSVNEMVKSLQQKHNSE